MTSQAHALGVETSNTYTGEYLAPETRAVGTEPKTGIRPRVQSAFAHHFEIFTGNGANILRISNPEITVNSDVTASIGEMTQNDVPFIGSAVMRVSNVAPFNGGVLVRVEVDFDRPLRFQVMLTYSI